MIKMSLQMFITKIIVTFMVSSQTYFLGWNIEGQCPHVHLLIGIYTWNDKEYSGTSGTTGEEPTKSKYNYSLIFLHNLYENNYACGMKMVYFWKYFTTLDTLFV